MITEETVLNLQLGPSIEPMDEGGIQAIYQSALKVLEQTGVRVSHPEALQMMRQAGVRVGEGDRVYIPSRLVEELLLTVPRQIELFDRTGRPALSLTGRNTYYGTGSDLAFTYDLETGELRQSTAQDIARMALVCDALPNIDFLMSYGIPFDRPKPLHYRHEFFEMVTHSTKPIVFTSANGEDSRVMIEMAAVAAGGMDNLRQRPFILNYCQPISPLQHSNDGIGKLLLCASLGIPINYPPGLIPGGTAPSTLAGAMVLSVAEALSGMVIHQLKRRGAPLVLCGAHGCMDMRSSVNVYAAPERMLTMWALTSIYQHLGIPTWGFGGCSDAQVLDEQAAMEFALLNLWASLTGVNLAHDTGYLGSGMIGSLQSLVLNDEIIGYTRHVMRGVGINEDTLATEVIDRVGPGGHYMGDLHTVMHFRSEFWQPGLSNRMRYEAWKKDGSQTMGVRLTEKAREILRTHKPQPLDPDQIRRMQVLMHGGAD